MRVLVVTANYAPRGASPAIRTVHLTKYLDRLGCKVDVLTYSEAGQTLFSPYDLGLVRKVSSGIRVFRVNPGPMRRLLVRSKGAIGNSVKSFKSRGKMNLFVTLMVPDPHMESIPSFLKASAALHKENNYDVVVTYGYPYSIHVVGYLLKRLNRSLIWFADYGDPWSGAVIEELLRPAWRKRLDYWLETKLLSWVDGVFLTTRSTQEVYSNLFPQVVDKLHVATMGFDPDDFENITESMHSGPQSKPIRLLYTGRLYTEARDSLAFISALEHVNEILPLKDRLCVVFMGDVDLATETALRASSVKHIVEFRQWQPLDICLAEMMTADYLLLFGNKGTLQIPGKLYQYMGSGTPVFYIKQQNTDPGADMLAADRKTIIACNNKDEISIAILYMLEKPYEERIKGDGSNRNHSFSQFSWPSVAKHILTIFEVARHNRALDT